MAHIIFAERENASLHPPNKMRQRLQSAPETLLKSPMIAKSFNTPLQPHRKAFGVVNVKNTTPAVNPKEKKLLKPHLNETKVKHAPPTKVEKYPEIEKFIPYDPLEFEKYSVPEDLVRLGSLALPGLTCFPRSPHLCELIQEIEPLPDLSPVKMPKLPGYCSELDAFLQTIDELTIELPPESVTN